MPRLLLFIALAPLLVHAGCDAWCKNDPNGWSTVCVWGICKDCAECSYRPPPPPLPPWGPGGCTRSCAADPDPWATVCERSGCEGCPECAHHCVPLNFRKSLLPSGGGWRGSTLEGDSFQGMYDDKFGSKLQVYRIFKGAGWAALSDDMKSFIKVCAAPPAPKPCPHGRSVALGEPSARRCSLQSGGIIFYSIHDLDWADIASGKKDARRPTARTRD